ncbi:MAG TPA: L-lactate permease [Anaeromyxobacter sp.]
MLALLAAAPVLFLFWALAVRHWRGHAAAAGALGIALVVATLAFRMPAPLALLSALHGFAFGLWPVAGIVGGAVLLYELVAATGELDVVKAALGSVTSDRRLQALLVAMGLGALLEGAAGFGTPVAIAGAMLAALGFPPVLAAAVALLANTAGVGFGALGIGMEVAGRVSGLDPAAVSALAMSMPALGATRRDVRLVIRRAFPALARPVLTISLVLAFAFLMKASGMAVALGGVLAETGRAFPALSPLVGAIGVLLTGAISSSNALFVPLQQVTAAHVGMAPLLAVAANVAGGVCAQMVAPQAMAVASAGIPGIAGREGEVLLRTAGRSVALLAGICATVALVAGPLGWVLPGHPTGAAAAAASPSAPAGWILLGSTTTVAAALALVARRAGRGAARRADRHPRPPPVDPSELP